MNLRNQRQQEFANEWLKTKFGILYRQEIQKIKYSEKN